MSSANCILAGWVVLSVMVAAVMARAAGRAMNDGYLAFHRDYTRATSNWSPGNKVRDHRVIVSKSTNLSTHFQRLLSAYDFDYSFWPVEYRRAGNKLGATGFTLLCSYSWLYSYSERRARVSNPWSNSSNFAIFFVVSTWFVVAFLVPEKTGMFHRREAS